MKLVINDKLLQEKMKEAITLLCGTVKKTLGPIGSNTIINNSSFSPFITNDGVTIAENIESEDAIINTILELAKESSLKTNEIVGDGTTTTLVLLESIFDNGLKLLKKGIKPVIIKKELESKLEEIINTIKIKSRIPNAMELLNIASISANDKKIGKDICDAYLKTKNKNSIYIKENYSSETIINNINGYLLDSNLASPFFLKDEKEINLDNPHIILVNNSLEHINEVASVINEFIINKKNLIILADDYSELFINEILSLNIEYNLNIILLKNPEYGVRKISILKDILSISNALVVENTNYITLDNLGTLDSIKISADNILIKYNKSKETLLRKNEIINDILVATDELEKEFHDKRLAMFDNGIIEILVGDHTTTARREKKMRYEDALCAISVAYTGVLPGSGLILYELSDNLNKNDIVSKILKNALKKPFEQIMLNAGVNFNQIIKQIKEKNYQIIYNLNTLKYESINNTEILDPTNVVINSVISSISIASMLLTTTTLVINEHQTLNKTNEYNEL